MIPLAVFLVCYLGIGLVVASVFARTKHVLSKDPPTVAFSGFLWPITLTSSLIVLVGKLIIRSAKSP